MFPVMLDVAGRRCLVVGGGAVARRKVRGLLAEQAAITVVAPAPDRELLELAAATAIDLQQRSYRAGEAAGYNLVFAATDQREVNRQVHDDADRAGVWVNVADDPELCSFQLPARVRRGRLDLAISSSGAAPFAVRRLRELLERRLGPEWADWIEAAAALRRKLLGADLERAAREEAFDRFWGETVVEGDLTVRQRHDVGHGSVALVGSGPGNPGLLTLRARRLLHAADAVVYDRLAEPALPCDLPASIDLHPVGKTAGHHPVPQDEINALLVRLARAGQRVVRLKGGDPFVFGRGGEEAEVLAAAGIPFEVVPGVTSGVAAPGFIGVPVTYRREAVRLTLLTAHESEKEDGTQLRWDLLAADEGASLVGYMGVSAIESVAANLIAAGMNPEMPAAMIERGSSAGQRAVVTTLADLPAAIVREEIKPPALFVISPTVRHAERLGWTDNLPLFGTRLIVPEHHRPALATLDAAGAELLPVSLPPSPAALVAVAALPVAGCVMVGEREEAALAETLADRIPLARMTAWCVGAAAAEQARARGWGSVQTADTLPIGAELLSWIRSTGLTAGGSTELTTGRDG